MKLQPTNMGFINSSRFSEHKMFLLEVIYKSSSALINAVMKYLNFRGSGYMLHESVTCKFTKYRTPFQ